MLSAFPLLSQIKKPNHQSKATRLSIKDTFHSVLLTDAVVRSVQIKCKKEYICKNHTENTLLRNDGYYLLFRGIRNDYRCCQKQNWKKNVIEIGNCFHTFWNMSKQINNRNKVHTPINKRAFNRLLCPTVGTMVRTWTWQYSKLPLLAFSPMDPTLRNIGFWIGVP